MSLESTLKSSKIIIYTVDAIECTSTLCSKATQAGLKIFNLMSIEDLMVREDGINGIVLNGAGGNVWIAY